MYDYNSSQFIWVKSYAGSMKPNSKMNFTKKRSNHAEIYVRSNVMELLKGLVSKRHGQLKLNISHPMEKYSNSDFYAGNVQIS